MLLALGICLLTSAGCLVTIPASGPPAHGYVYGSGAPLRVAVLDETTSPDRAWSAAIGRAVATYGAATPELRFVGDPAAANIVVHVRRYRDQAPPVIPGYAFQPGVGGFAAVYDASGVACNFPPATVPVGCSGEITTVDIYLNDIIPPGPDIEARRDRLLLHELGHAMGLTRHSPDLDIAQLAARYGWPAGN